MRETALLTYRFNLSISEMDHMTPTERLLRFQMFKEFTEQENEARKKQMKQN